MKKFLRTGNYFNNLRVDVTYCNNLLIMISLLFSVSAYATETGVQLLGDPGFELSDPDHNLFPSSGLWQPEWVGGEAGAVCTRTASHSENVGLWIYTGEAAAHWWVGPYQIVAAKPGDIFTGRTWCRSMTTWVTGSQAKVRISFLNTLNVPIATYDSPVIAQSDIPWQELSIVTEPAPAGTAHLLYRLYLEKPNGITGQSVANFDDTYLELTSEEKTDLMEVYPANLGITRDEITRSLELKNLSAGAVDWTLTAGTSWISTITPSEGSLPAGGTQTVTVTINRDGLTGEIYKGTITLSYGSISTTIGVYLDMWAGYTVPSQPSRVTIDGYRMLFQRRQPDGNLGPLTPILFKGAAWSPSSRGSTGSPTNRRSDFSVWYVSDVQMMKEMNATVVYVFIDFGVTQSAFNLLDCLYKNKLYAIVTVDEDGSNNTDCIAQIVTAYKNHPAVLAWAIGNEWNINYYHGKYGNPDAPSVDSLTAAAQATEQAALQIKALDDTHPVISIHGEINIDERQPLLPTQDYLSTHEIINEVCPSVDVWGLNIYRGNTFGNLFAEWASISTKPMFISEFGTDSFFTTDQNPPPHGYISETAQSDFLETLLQELESEFSAYNINKVCLGGTVFEFNDEWFKVKLVDGGSNTLQDTGGFYSWWNPSTHPDGFANEEWFGLVSIDRVPKKAYTITQTHFSNVQNLAPIIIGQKPLGTPAGAPLTITLDDLLVSDLDNTYPAGFSLTINNGLNYEHNGNTITPVTGFVGVLAVPVSINDGIADSQEFSLQIAVNMDIEGEALEGEGEGEIDIFHLADLNKDWRIVLGEAIAYLAGWQGGSNPMSYAIRAAYLWQNGEQYHYDAGESAPLCWALGPVEGEGEILEGEGEDCDDSNPCTIDSYDAELGGCVHSQINCDDGEECTIDSCDPETGLCLHTPYCETQDPCPFYVCIPIEGIPMCLFMCKEAEE